MNAPPTFESFLLFDGEKKITKEQDTKVEILNVQLGVNNVGLSRYPTLQFSPSIKRITQWAT